MNDCLALRRRMTRFLLPIAMGLMSVSWASAQLAPVVEAGDDSWMSAFNETPTSAAPTATPSPAPSAGCNSADCSGGDSILHPSALDGYGCGTGCGTGCGSGCGDTCGSSCGSSCMGCYPGGGGLMAMAVGCNKTKRIDLFGEYLYLRPRNAEVAYAVPIDGPIAPVLGNGIQIGRTALVDPNHNAAYRVGLNLVGCGCSAITAQWTKYENSDMDAINIGVPDVIRSLVTHPLDTNAASDGLQASARLDIDFELIDLIMRTPWKRCRQWHTDILYGVRYGQLVQNFSSSIDVNGSTDVLTDIDFNGVGPQIGINSVRQLGGGGLFLHSRADASFMVGSFDATYLQQDNFSGTLVDSSWESGRIVPMLELEIGWGWVSRSGMFQLRAGYMVNAWFNAVRTSEWINAVQSNNPDDLGSGITFDGMAVRAELRF